MYRSRATSRSWSRAESSIATNPAEPPRDLLLPLWRLVGLPVRFTLWWWDLLSGVDQAQIFKRQILARPDLLDEVFLQQMDMTGDAARIAIEMRDLYARHAGVPAAKLLPDDRERKLLRLASLLGPKSDRGEVCIAIQEATGLSQVVCRDVYWRSGWNTTLRQVIEGLVARMSAPTWQHK